MVGISRRKFLGVAITATGLGLLVNQWYTGNRTTLEEMPVQELTGIVKGKRRENSRYTTIGRILSHVPAKDLVDVDFKYGTITRNAKNLFDKVNQGSEVLVSFKETYQVTRTYRGEFLERRLYNREVISVTPK